MAYCKVVFTILLLSSLQSTKSHKREIHYKIDNDLDSNVVQKQLNIIEYFFPWIEFVKHNNSNSQLDTKVYFLLSADRNGTNGGQNEKINSVNRFKNNSVIIKNILQAIGLTNDFCEQKNSILADESSQYNYPIYFSDVRRLYINDYKYSAFINYCDLVKKFYSAFFIEDQLTKPESAWLIYNYYLRVNKTHNNETEIRMYDDFVFSLYINDCGANTEYSKTRIVNIEKKYHYCKYRKVSTTSTTINPKPTLPRNTFQSTQSPITSTSVKLTTTPDSLDSTEPAERSNGSISTDIIYDYSDGDDYEYEDPVNTEPPKPSENLTTLKPKLFVEETSASQKNMSTLHRSFGDQTYFLLGSITGKNNSDGVGNIYKRESKIITSLISGVTGKTNPLVNNTQFGNFTTFLFKRF